MRNFALVLFVILLTGLIPHAFADAQIVGPYTIQYNGTIYRAVDDQGIFFVDLDQFQAEHPDVPLPDLSHTLYELYGERATIEPVIVQLTDYIDCTQTDHNYSDANIFDQSPHPNKPARLMTINGRTYRVTAAPDDGFATYYYSYDFSTGGTAGVPHLLIAESVNDQERYTSLIIQVPDGQPWAPPYSGEPTYNPWGDPWWEENPEHTQQGPVFEPDVGVTIYTGREYETDSQPFNIPLIFYAKSPVMRLVVSSLGACCPRTSTDGGAVSRVWVFEAVDDLGNRLPSLTLPDDPAQERRIGIYVPHSWFLYAHYGTPVRLLSHRQAGLQNVVELLKFCGFNWLEFNAINGSDMTSRAWYQGSAYFDWNSAGDLLAELPPIAESAGIQLVPVITSLNIEGLSGFTDDSYQVSRYGDWTKAFGNRLPDPLRPEVQQLVSELIDEIATRVVSYSCVKGIGLRVNGKIGLCYAAHEDGWRGADESGYSAWDLQQFKNDTGSAVPVSPPSTAYNWLRSRPDEWERWINWRCERMRDFWLQLRDQVKSYRSDWNLYIKCVLPSETPGTNIQWPGETPYNLLRYHGYDPNMFHDEEGIVIERGMMVAEDRFYNGCRWAPPWGSNHQNYKAFHYASGLPEMYYTAEGRAAELYHNYWEEAFNPYWEYGVPNNPYVGWFRTTTPAARKRAFFEPITMSLRRQNVDTLVLMGWERPILGHENDLRKFAIAFRALPKVDPVDFDGTISPSTSEVWVKWFGNRLAVLNDSSQSRTITLTFNEPVPEGEELVDVVSGKVLLSATDTQRQVLTIDAEPWSLYVYLYSGEPPSPPPPPPPPPPVPGVDNPSFEESGGSYDGWEIVRVYGEGPDNPPLDNTNPFGPRTPFGDHFGGKITNGLPMSFYLGQVVGVSNWHEESNGVHWQMSVWVQLYCMHENNPNPTGVHQVWEIGWNNDGSEPTSIMNCDNYQVIADIDGTYTGNDQGNFYQLTASGTITGVPGLRAVAIRVHMYNDAAWWWTSDNIDNLDFVATSTFTAQTPAGFYKTGWNLTSVPVEPISPDPNDVFQDLVALGNIMENNLFTYEPSSGYLLYPTDFTSITCGQAYWLFLTNTSDDTVVSVQGTSSTEDIHLPLTEGWNLIGHPFMESIPLSACQVSDGETTLSFLDAISAGWLQETLYYYDPGAGYKPASPDNPEDNSLCPWYGYWILAFEDGLELIVPAP